MCLFVCSYSDPIRPQKASIAVVLGVSELVLLPFYDSPKNRLRAVVDTPFALHLQKLNVHLRLEEFNICGVSFFVKEFSF